jgi:FkbM family methyltransferase
MTEVAMEKFCLKNIYSHLEDDESKFWFEKRLQYSLTGDMQRMLNSIKKMKKREPFYKKIFEAKEIFLFGSGICGHIAVNTLPEVRWKAFIDNDKNKIGKQDILPIISFQEFIQNSQNALVFISSLYHQAEMKQQLINNGFPENSIIEGFNRQYFDLSHFKPQKNEFFIDAGAWDGYTTKDFFQWSHDNGENRSILFEPNPIQYSICQDNLRKWNCSNVKIINKGLWHKEETLRFHKADMGSRISSDGEEIIETISLDEYLKNEEEPVTFIKMDIEGAELNALKGAEQTIKKYKPKLAICIYHKPEDIWEIPNILLDFVPNYKFYIRHYYFDDRDTILYAM